MKQKLSERLLELVTIDSVIEHEHAICDAVERQIARCSGVTCQRVGRSLAVRPKERKHDAMVCLVGHLDTVPPPAENPPRIADGRVYGLGSSDMKAGLAIMLGLMQDPVTKPAYDISYVFYDGEEGPYDGSGLGPLLDEVGWLRQEIDLGFCLEPSDNVLQLGCLGTINARVTFRGAAAHSARPWQGDNAIHKAGGLLTRLNNLSPVAHQFVVSDEITLDYREVVSATLASGGTARNMVPAEMSVNLNYRYAPGRSPESAEAFLQELVAGEAELHIFDHGPSGAVPKDNPLLDRFRTICPVPVAAKQAWTDVGRFSVLGIDAVNFGPGKNAQAHQVGEHADIALLEEGDMLFRRFLSQS